VLLGSYGGLVGDRAGKRRLLGTQSVLGVLALVLGLLRVTHVVRLWMVFVLAVALGTLNSVDQPTRQTFVPEMVGRVRLQSAVSLNSVLTNVVRAIGPAVAGVLIATVGVGVCLLANAASFAAVLAALARIRSGDLHPRPVRPRPANAAVTVSEYSATPVSRGMHTPGGVGLAYLAARCAFAAWLRAVLADPRPVGLNCRG
jgi:MFS family permease